MSIVGPNQGAITPVPVNRPVAGGPARQVVPTPDAAAAGSAQLTAQQLGAESGKRGQGAPQNPGGGGRTGAQPLNATGRGQIVNLIV